MEFPRVSYFLINQITCYRSAETPSGCTYTFQDFVRGRTLDIGTATIEGNNIETFNVPGDNGAIRQRFENALGLKLSVKTQNLDFDG